MRADSWSRRLGSAAFGLYFRLLFPVSARDPSGVPVLLSRAALMTVLPYLGRLDPGIWWEVVAVAHCWGLQVAEVPIHHRPRPDGQTRVYGWRKLPMIALKSAVGLLRLWAKTRRIKGRPRRVEPLDHVS